MPGKNKPKRLDRNKSWRVQRRKRERAKLASGGGRSRKKREKKSKVSTEVKTVVKPKIISANEGKN
jgi:hypothetical protein